MESCGNDIILHRIESSDWLLLKTIRLQALGDAPEAFGTPLADEEKQPDEFWKARASNDKVGTFVAVNNTPCSASAAPGERRPEDCVGLITGAPCLHREEGSDAGEGAAGLYSMWVSPASRRRNVGKLLVEEVKMWARKEGLYTRVLLIVADYNVPAQRLYEACGFAPSGIIFAQHGDLPETEYSCPLY